MTISREQVGDLRPGDVVEYSGHKDLHGAKVVGPLRCRRGGLFVADYLVRHTDGEPPAGPWGDPVLTVVSRAPRPLYTNSDRAEPVPGDVVRDSEGALWMRDGFKTWQGVESTCAEEHADVGLPRPLTLLVDGETGQVVP